MKIRRTVEWAGGDWKYRGKVLRATHEQAKYMSMGGRGRGRYRVDYTDARKKPDAFWLRLGPRTERPAFGFAAVTLVSGRQISVCRNMFKKVFGTSKAGWIRLTKV